jgi:hypothetical protein
MKSSSTKLPAHNRVKRAAFEVRAERALRRAVRNVHLEHHRLGLPLIVWQDGRVAQVPAGV